MQGYMQQSITFVRPCQFAMLRIFLHQGMLCILMRAANSVAAMVAL